MALNKDLILQNDSLKSLTEDQIDTLVTLSTNDEAQVIGKRIGEIHGQYDIDIEAVTGIKKPNGKKTYEFLKTDILPKVKEYQSLSEQIATLKEEKIELEKKLKSNSGDEVLKKQLKDTENLLSQFKNQYETDINKYKGEVETYKTELTKSKIYNEQDKVLAKIKFKDDSIIPNTIKEREINAAKDRVAAKGTFDWVEVDSKKLVVIRDEAGNIICNPKNKMQPYTIEELLTEELKEIIDTTNKKAGAGTGAGKKSSEETTFVDLSGIKTQIEADNLIIKHLLQKGLPRGSKEFADEQSKIRKENNVDKLPIQ